MRRRQSDYDTVAIAEHHGARIVTTARGRGAQLHAGACTARGRTLWFLHADTRPPADAVRRIAEALADPAVVGGNFEILFSGNSRPDCFLNWLYPRLRWLGLSYGDSAYFMRRSAYEQIGGFRPYPIFEDLDLLPAVAADRPIRRRPQCRGHLVTQLRGSPLHARLRTLGHLASAVLAGSSSRSPGPLLRQEAGVGGPSAESSPPTSGRESTPSGSRSGGTTPP